MNKTLDDIIKYYSCLTNEPCETCMMRGFSRFEQCQYVKDFKSALRELLEGEIEEIKSKVINSEIKSTSNASLQGKLDILSEVKKTLNEVLK